MENNEYVSGQNDSGQSAAPQQPVRRQRPTDSSRPAGSRPNNGNRRPASKRRKRRTKMQVFKETYLPIILLVLGIVLIITVIVTLSVNSKNRKDEAAKESYKAAEAKREYQLKLKDEADKLVKEADMLAAGFDYDGAIAVLDSFSDDEYFYEFDNLVKKRKEYEDAKKTLVAWDDPGQVVSLSTQHLIAEANRAFNYQDSDKANNIKYNYITINEFSAILKSLYDNGYILVSLDDIFSIENGECKAKTMYLPEGKKPLLLIQTHNSAQIVYDGDGDYTKDCSAGFSSRLLVDKAGNLTSEKVFNKTETGDFDFVPILETFVKEHPDFSYKGARAIMAVTGIRYVFGYEINPDYPDPKYLKEERDITAQIEQATKVANKLKELGYDIACYTYANDPYGTMDISEIQEDVTKWKEIVGPIVGETNILVYGRDSDIAAPGEAYSGSKYELLNSEGFQFFIGFCEDSDPWAVLGPSYARLGRLTINGSKLLTNPGLYEDIFDAVAAKDSLRK